MQRWLTHAPFHLKQADIDRYINEAKDQVSSRQGQIVQGALTGVGLLVEVITGWPGLGPLLLEASISRDLYVVIGVVMSSTVFMIMGNLLADVLLAAVDPRVRTE